MNNNIKIVSQLSLWPHYNHTSFFNSSDWAALMAHDPKAMPIIIVAYSEKGELIMTQNAIFMHQLPFLPKCLGSSCVLWGPPDVVNPSLVSVDLYQSMLLSLKRFARCKALFIEARHFEMTTPWAVCFTSLHFKAIPWFNIVHTLSANNSIEQGISKRRRRQIKEAFLKGAIIEENPTEGQWNDFYQILSHYYRLIRRPLPSQRVFKQLLQQKQLGFCMVALSSERTVIGGIACLHGNSSTCYAWYTAALDRDPQWTHYYPSIILNFAALKRASAMNLKSFDFQGAGAQNSSYGVRDFKLRFGGDLIKTYRFRTRLIFF